MEFAEVLGKEQLVFKERADDLAAGKIDAAEFKKTAAPLGVYEQRDGKFMVRLRVSGGHISAKKFMVVANLAKQYGARFLHITTRQDIQFHDVGVPQLYPLIDECTRAGMPFRGGGGNTYRNIVACDHSGLTDKTVFDVAPHVQALNDFLLRHPAAFGLPRKFKAGLSCCAADHSMAKIQDLGFIAKMAGGKRGFEVYAGGGMGARDSRTGIKIFDFLGEKDMLKCADAAIHLFNDRGNREDRTRARLRFVLSNLGEEEFRKLFMEYYAKTEKVPPCTPEKIEYSTKSFPAASAAPDSGFDLWKKAAVDKSGAPGKSNMVRVFVPGGDLSVDAARSVAEIAEYAGCEFLRISQIQDIVLPLVHDDALPEVFRMLKRASPDFTGASLRGRICRCVGAKFCKIGVLDTSIVAAQIEAALGKHAEANPPQKDKISSLIGKIRISGCPNSCSGHHVAEFGLQGKKKNVAGEVSDFYVLLKGGSTAGGKITLGTPADEIPSEKVPERLLAEMKVR